jgi:trans-aconitate methyltransferase
MSVHKPTITNYNQSAQAMAEHFQSYDDGAAKGEIELAVRLAGNPKRPRIVEVGCGAGKDAAEIFRIAGWYEGFDPAVKLLELARAHVPAASFVQADTLSYDYPKELNIVFAFASMLHLDKQDFAQACQKIAAALQPGGVLCLSLKEADTYTKLLQQDKFGERLFYLYTVPLVRELAGDAFEQVYESHQLAGPEKKRWFTLILRKK